MNRIFKQTGNNDLFLSSKDGNYTYGDLHKFARYFTAFLQHHDVEKDKPVGLCVNSSDKLIFIISACWLHNIPFASFNPDSPGTTLSDQINRLDPSLMITGESSLIRGSVQSINIDTINLEQILAGNSKSSGESVSELCSRNIDEDNIFGYFFTSGTSGAPKIVPLKRRQMLAAARSSAQNLHPAVNELWLLCLPLYHIGGVSVILRSMLYGSGIYRMGDFDADQAGRLLAEDRSVTAVSLVPTMLMRLIESNSFNSHPELKGILLGGGPIPPGLLANCTERNIPMIPSYGMTETCAQIAANPIFLTPENPNVRSSAVFIFEPNRIEIRDEEGLPVNDHSSGSVWLKGPQVFDGYLDESHDTFDNKGSFNTGNIGPIDDRKYLFDADGWFNTGDYGRLGANGQLFIEARRTDLIISGGENVSPFEVERELLKIEGIREAAVFGLPDDDWGQKVVAAVIFEGKERQPNSELQKVLKRELEAFKVPKEMLAVDSLPRTETGKIKRSELSAVFSSKQ